MSSQEADLKRISDNFTAFRTLCETKLGERTEPVLKMLEALGTRLAMTPASSRTEYHAAYPGGLVEHSLRVCKYALKLNEMYGTGISQASVIIATLFHDLGKIGDLTEDYYIDQDDDWKRERGMVYRLNDKIQKMPTAHRSVWLLQHFGVTLTMDEWIAICTNDGQYVDENKPYSMNEPTLAILVHHADRMACDREKSGK